MSRQYNMYNVQLSEFWKQRIDKEAQHNAPFLQSDGGSELDDVASTISRGPSMLSTTSTISQQKVRAHGPPQRPPRRTRLRPQKEKSACSLTDPAILRLVQIDELTKRLEEERAKRIEAEKILQSFQDGK